MNIHLAVPHYNAPEQLEVFLARAEMLGFDGVTVLDDASSDRAAVEKVAAKYDNVQFVYGEKNVGAGGNRNRMLDAVHDGVLAFVDCDTEIVSENMVEILRQQFRDSHRRMIGGLVLDKAGRPMPWNYGHEMHPVDDARFEELARMMDGDNRDAVWQRLGKLGMDYAWLQGDRHPERRVVDWVAEGCFAVGYDDFHAVGGYDASLRYHEGQDLAHRLRENGVEVIFDPGIVVRHLEIDVRHDNRARERRDGAFRFYEKYWGMTRGVFDQLMKRY